jgi:hypothetical protein
VERTEGRSDGGLLDCSIARFVPMIDGELKSFDDTVRGLTSCTAISRVKLSLNCITTATQHTNRSQKTILDIPKPLHPREVHSQS